MINKNITFGTKISLFVLVLLCSENKTKYFAYLVVAKVPS